MVDIMFMKPVIGDKECSKVTLKCTPWPPQVGPITAAGARKALRQDQRQVEKIYPEMLRPDVVSTYGK